MEFIAFGIWAAGAVIVVGLIEWGKNLAPNAPVTLWKILGPVFALLAAIASVYQRGIDVAIGANIVWTALGIWSLSQIGYQIIIQTIKKRLTGE